MQGRISIGCEILSLIIDNKVSILYTTKWAKRIESFSCCINSKHLVGNGSTRIVQAPKREMKMTIIEQ